jgi:tetratricopeptide (TPR) repeat protein
MARKQYGKQFGKVFAAIILLIVTVIGLSYGSLLRGMDQAADEYSRGDAEAALSLYEGIDQRLTSIGALRAIPAKDRRNLILNQARLLYELGRYDDALGQMDRETEITGTTSDDGRFLLLKGQIAFRKAVMNYREADQTDPQLLDESFRGAEDNLRDSLRLSPNDWDAKYNFEFVNYIRNLLKQNQPVRLRLLMENVRVKELPPTVIPPEKQQ